MAAGGTGTAGINCTKQKGGIGKIFAVRSFGRTLPRSHGYALFVMGYHTPNASVGEQAHSLHADIGHNIEMVNVFGAVSVR